LDGSETFFEVLNLALLLLVFFLHFLLVLQPQLIHSRILTLQPRRFKVTFRS
jgi:hypothetical protein